jgi:hypothetical protein
MTAIQQLWLASLVGAVAFFVAGVLVASARRRAAQPARGAADRGELDALRQRADQADAQLQQAQGELTAARRQQREAGPPPGQLQDRLDAADRALAERTAQLREAATQLEAMKGRVNDAEAMRSDYVRLRTQVNEMDYLTKEVERLKGELRSAKSVAIGGVVKPLVKPASSALPVAAAGSITDALSGAIARFGDPKMRAVAIADKVGFPVSSQGEEGVELAAYAALLGEVAARATLFLPVAAPASIELVDEHGARISVWPFDVDDDRLLLVKLGIGTTDPKRVEQMLSDVGRILSPEAAPA